MSPGRLHVCPFSGLPGMEFLGQGRYFCRACGVEHRCGPGADMLRCSLCAELCRLDRMERRGRQGVHYCPRCLGLLPAEKLEEPA